MNIYKYASISLFHQNIFKTQNTFLFFIFHLFSLLFFAITKNRFSIDFGQKGEQGTLCNQAYIRFANAMLFRYNKYISDRLLKRYITGVTK